MGALNLRSARKRSEDWRPKIVISNQLSLARFVDEEKFEAEGGRLSLSNSRKPLG